MLAIKTDSGEWQVENNRVVVLIVGSDGKLLANQICTKGSDPKYVERMAKRALMTIKYSLDVERGLSKKTG